MCIKHFELSISITDFTLMKSSKTKHSHCTFELIPNKGKRLPAALNVAREMKAQEEYFNSRPACTINSPDFVGKHLLSVSIFSRPRFQRSFWSQLIRKGSAIGEGK
jgi:hypothetical protein